MTRTVFLTTKTTDLVHLTVADAPAILPWLNNHDITRFLNRGDRPLALAEEEKFLGSLYTERNKLVLGIWHKEAEKLIGMTGLHSINPINQTAVFGITIGDTDFHNQGIGQAVLSAMCSHAFNWLNLRNVVLHVLGNNPRAITCYTRVGFTEVGNYSAFVFKDGEWVDEIHMLLRRENFLLSLEEEAKRQTVHQVATMTT